MTRVSGSWFHCSQPKRQIDNVTVPSKILKVALAVLAILASFAFLTTEIALIATVVILGASFFSLQRINHIYYKTSPRPFFQRFNPFWAPTFHHNRWNFWPSRASVGTGRVSPITRVPLRAGSSPHVVLWPRRNLRYSPQRGFFFYREQTRARPGERR